MNLYAGRITLDYRGTKISNGHLGKCRGPQMTRGPQDITTILPQNILIILNDSITTCL